VNVDTPICSGQLFRRGSLKRPPYRRVIAILEVGTLDHQNQNDAFSRINPALRAEGAAMAKSAG
jgi:hypothetical protein